MNKQNPQINDVLKLLERLPQNDLETIVDELYSKIVSNINNVDDSVYNLANESVVVCHNCGSVHIVKNGKDRHGHTRYLCRDCKKTFGALNTTVVFRTHKDSKTWHEYIKCMLQGFSIAKSAEICGLALQTAFTWRHKILNALSSEAFPSTFGGMIEMDEMFVRISYKGNHKNSKTFTMPRAPFKRGSDNVDVSNTSKATVLCVVERNKGFSGTVACRGAISLPLLKNLFDERISADSIVMTDGLHTYGRYFKETELCHVVLPAHKNGKKPTVNGAYHINNVNALHRRFRQFLAKYNGVATKYLNNYLSLFLWLENNKHYDKEKFLNNELTKEGSYISKNELSLLAPTPELAPAA